MILKNLKAIEKNQIYKINKNSGTTPYFNVYNEHFVAQIFEGKVSIHIVHG